MSNADKIILDLCGGTGSWSKPYKDAGYTVHVITLPDHDLMRSYFFEEDGEEKICFTNVGMDHKEIVVPVKAVYGILAAPTCTMFSMARTVAKTPRDLRGAMELVKKCLEIVEVCQLNDNRLKFWALENPKARLRWFLGRPPLTFNPYEFGDPHRKPTDLWGNFNTELERNPVELDAKQKKQTHLNTRELPQLPSDYTLPKDFSRRAAQRSITPPGFANAFFKANK